MRNQGFIHPYTLYPDYIDNNKVYEARIQKLNTKFEDLS
jgi:hypothetical protein